MKTNWCWHVLDFTLLWSCPWLEVLSWFVSTSSLVAWCSLLEFDPVRWEGWALTVVCACVLNGSSEYSVVQSTQSSGVLGMVGTLSILLGPDLGVLIHVRGQLSYRGQDKDKLPVALLDSNMFGRTDHHRWLPKLDSYSMCTCFVSPHLCCRNLKPEKWDTDICMCM